MAPVLARCDREGMRAYLDATSQRNRRLYERHGFARGAVRPAWGAAAVADVAPATSEG
jgi:hypothetical protein